MAPQAPGRGRLAEWPIDAIFGRMAAIRKDPWTQAVVSLDETDHRLLSELQEDARLSLAELGRRVGLSSPAVAERVRRLGDAGVITGYRVEIDPRALGFGLG